MDSLEVGGVLVAITLVVLLLVVVCQGQDRRVVASSGQTAANSSSDRDAYVPNFIHPQPRWYAKPAGGFQPPELQRQAELSNREAALRLRGIYTDSGPPLNPRPPEGPFDNVGIPREWRLPSTVEVDRYAGVDGRGDHYSLAAGSARPAPPPYRVLREPDHEPAVGRADEDPRNRY
jgi:hypothetical protein